MLTIPSTRKIGVMDKTNAPAAYCDAGDTVIFETMDCSDGAVARDGSRDRTPGKFIPNPATGPLYVRGAKKGDILKVTILSIKTADWGFMGTGFDDNCFAGIKGDYSITTFDLTDGKAHIGNKAIPLSPMIGVIGVAPAGEGVDTETPLDHGGNMDCTLISEGAEVYFPVGTDGALLAMGDLHAVMGDGEVFLYGLEVAGEVTVRVEVLPGSCLTMPAVVKNSRLSVIASAKTLAECSRRAIRQMHAILMENGWNKTDAGRLMSMQCDLTVCQTVDPNQTVRASMDVALIKA